ncbi:MAG TPA: enoyl-CoA hydratase-related protein, partial [Syntrophomonas sp.]|nr:enoyl-CoA hydratase-related protein [Syntrophomonas sp.]
NLIYKKENGLAVVILNRPKAFNALSEALIDELNQVLTLLEEDADVRALILTGSRKVFAAGGDVSGMVEANTLDIYYYGNKIHKAFDRLEDLPFPTIAAINGPALGGGCEIAMCCDFRIAGECSVFGQPEISLGIMPGAGGTQRLAKLIGVSRAKEMIFLGANINAIQALEMGLVNQIVADDIVFDEAKAMAAKLMAKPAVALRFAKEAINTGINKDLITGKGVEKAKFAMAFSTHDQKEGMKAFIEKRAPEFKHN